MKSDSARHIRDYLSEDIFIRISNSNNMILLPGETVRVKNPQDIGFLISWLRTIQPCSDVIRREFLNCCIGDIHSSFKTMGRDYGWQVSCTGIIDTHQRWLKMCPVHALLVGEAIGYYPYFEDKELDLKIEIGR